MPETRGNLPEKCKWNTLPTRIQIPRIRLQLQDGPHITTQESNRLPKLGQTKIQADHYQSKPKGKNPTLEMLLLF